VARHRQRTRAVELDLEEMSDAPNLPPSTGLGSWVLGLPGRLGLGSWSQPEDWVLGLGSWGRRRPDFLGLKRLKSEKLPFFSFNRFSPKNTRRTLSSLPFWYASELDSDVGLGESHRFFGYNTKLSVTYGAQSARRNF
jgi:hypothetical protein